jgi:hypothetical protein
MHRKLISKTKIFRQPIWVLVSRAHSLVIIIETQIRWRQTWRNKSLSTDKFAINFFVVDKVAGTPRGKHHTSYFKVL